MSPDPRPSPPPGTWLPARRLAESIVRPLERFLHVQAASGLLLLAAAALALAWANSPYHASYEHLWHTPVTLGLGGWVFRESLHFWINEGLMVVFFFVVGLEIRREMHHGELSELRRAALPVFAALGGMIAPALIYFALNPAPPARSGWGVPTATDIAFAVGVLALLGKRVPAAIRVLLLALAIIDDIGAIIVIALFYSSGISLVGLLIALLGVAGVFALRIFGVRPPLAYVLPGAVLWAGLLRAGVHPTIGGVILGLLTPVNPWFGKARFVDAMESAIHEFRHHSTEGHGAHSLLRPLARIRVARREALAPLVRLEAALHPWVAYGIMPLFAFANAGVRLGGIDLGAPASSRIVLGVVLGLVLGKPLGILAASFLAVRARIAALPRGVTWRGVTLVGLVAGIGFTMAIFIAGLAFPDDASLGAAKLGVLLASAIAAVVGLAGGRALLRGALSAEVASITVDEAEASTEH
ncbi:Na+/H+ antiporter NhaA [Polyangium aurulentum]|uniref:Na+/H+ antiporter NhaA n=1 Tax=Polyangium aurulentum TaxID=2567896 RepID=UPI0010AE8B93|nr:Na+/H+ antiporter NhaA [Polyangium aurulentum]UQA57976.1 Na+/H+ antiporter NhaA [Polyangium aurulentum]